MIPTIQIKATSADVETYRDLLRADWSKETLGSTIELLAKLMAKNLKSRIPEWCGVLLVDSVRKTANEFNADILDRIRDLSLSIREPAIPEMPARFTATRPTHLAALAERAWASLTLQANANLEGETALFADVQSLAYLCCVHFLLPHLHRQGMQSEHDCLVCALYLHTVLVWRANPAHFLYLQSSLMDYLGNRERRLELLELSFQTTPPTDHSYLTKATAYWSDLMDSKRYEQAGHFLLSLARTAPRECQDEIQDMLAELMTSARNGSG